MTEKTADEQRGRPFPKGVSGNPDGRPPRGWTWRDLLVEAADEVAKGSKDPKKKIMARKLVDLGVSGEVSAIKEFGDRMDGKPKQALVGGDEDDPPVLVKVRYE